MLTDNFSQLFAKNSKDHELANNLWLEIFTKYSDSKRHYHTIDHLEAMISDLKNVKDKVNDWDTLLLAVFFHDIIYKAVSSTNEEDSAKIAKQRLTEAGYPIEKTEKCTRMILATKLHNLSEDNDTNFLIDVDLAILGKNEEEYRKYTEQIREEYNVYPDFIYNSGRKKVIQHLLRMEKIYKTEYFFEKYEKTARTNLVNELQELEN
ncbi:hypothetical protein [Flavobacterium sp. UBA7682]|uniref:HD domain-containing protein n=1 Tax=Flavobacterium sp. UBA7682 TaxID=1946560 RepID=UPI0025B91E28|nr:hypothetical protein [Flavobacterium sp. UBA7682]